MEERAPLTNTDDRFSKLLERHENEIRLHCYRMLGSSHDSDDMLQETLTRAFRAKETLAHEESARAWLYRIATNVCLDELARRKKRLLPREAGPPAMEPNPAIGPPEPDAYLESSDCRIRWKPEHFRERRRSHPS